MVMVGVDVDDEDVVVCDMMCGVMCEGDEGDGVVVEAAVAVRDATASFEVEG